MSLEKTSLTRMKKIISECNMEKFSAEATSLFRTVDRDVGNIIGKCYYSKLCHVLQKSSHEMRKFDLLNKCKDNICWNREERGATVSF